VLKVMFKASIYADFLNKLVNDTIKNWMH
jgi:hypothetical protein